MKMKESKPKNYSWWGHINIILPKLVCIFNAISNQTTKGWLYRCKQNNKKIHPGEEKTDNLMKTSAKEGDLEVPLSQTILKRSNYPSNLILILK